MKNKIVSFVMVMALLVTTSIPTPAAPVEPVATVNIVQCVTA